MTEPLKFLTLQEAADLLRVPVATIRYWRTVGKIKVVKPGRHPLVLQQQLLKDLGLDQAVAEAAKTDLEVGPTPRLNRSAGGRS